MKKDLNWIFGTFFVLALFHPAIGSACEAHARESAKVGRNFVNLASARTRVKNPKVRTALQKKYGANAVFCDASSGSVATVCAKYRAEVEPKEGPVAGMVAIACTDLQAREMWCCNGNVGSGSIPPTATAPCFADLKNEASLIP